MKRYILVLAFVGAFFNCRSQTVTDTLGNTVVEISVALDTTHFQSGYASSPWDLYWGPDQKLWYTNKNTLCRYDPLTEIADTILTIPSGYIMAVTAHGDFFNNPYVYVTIDTALYYGQGQIINVFRYDYSLTGDSLFNPQYMLHWYHPGEHSGGRLIYGQDQKIYISTAEYWVSYDTIGQNSGKVLRMNPDGSIPSDNPRPDYTWSYGHRNPQGIVQVPNGNIFVSEYGQIMDEVNLIQENKYYGWIIYDGFNCIAGPDSCAYYDTIAVFPVDAGMNPPSGIDYYNHPAIPEFNGLIQAVTGFVKQGIMVYAMNASHDSVVQKTNYLAQEYGRVRDVCASPDGSVYFIARDRFNPDIRRIRNPLYTAMTAPDKNKDFRFYPTVTNGTIRYAYEGDDVRRVEVMDLNGRILFNELLNTSRGILDLRHLTNGCYFFSVTVKDRRTVYKFIVAK